MASQGPKNRIKRFSAAQRLFSFVAYGHFLIQGSTGLGRMYIETGWGQSLAAVSVGTNALTVHYLGSAFSCLALFIGHLVYLFLNIDWKTFPDFSNSPDSLLPRRRTEAIFSTSGMVFRPVRSAEI